MKSIEKQQKEVNNLLKLIKENPELEILPMVDTECVFSDDYSYWMAEWGEARIDEYWCSDERAYFKNYEFDSLVEDWIDNNYEDYPELSDNELEKIAEEKINGYKWVKAIIVYIRPL